MALQRPGQPDVQPGRQVGRDDLAEAQPHANLARLDAEQAACKIKQGQSGERGHLEPRRRQADAVQLRDPLAQPVRLTPSRRSAFITTRSEAPTSAAMAPQSVA